MFFAFRLVGERTNKGTLIVRGKTVDAAALEQELARHTLHFRQQSGFAGEDHCEYVYTVFLPRRRTSGDFAAQMTGVAGVQQANWVRG